MPEMTKVEELVLSVVKNARTLRASDLFERITDRDDFAPYTTREIVAAIWRLKDRGLISVDADGTLTPLEAPRSRRVAALA